MSVFNMRLDDDLKKEVLPVLESYGLTMPQAIKLFFTQIAKTKAIPLSLDYNGIHPSDKTKKAIQDALEGKMLAYDNFDDFLKELKK